MYVFRNIYKIINIHWRSLSGIKEIPMEIFNGRKLLSCSGALVNAEKVLMNKKMIALYFSASWCNPCKTFLPQIKAIYKENNKRNMGLEIIYISADIDEEKMIKYFTEKHSNWFAVPYQDPLAEELTQMFGVESVPHFFVLNSKGAIVSANGRKDVEEHGVNVLVKWNSDPL